MFVSIKTVDSRYRRALARRQLGQAQAAAVDAQRAAQLLPELPEAAALQKQLMREAKSIPETFSSKADIPVAGFGSLLQIAPVPGEGRALVTRGAVQPGQELMRDQPFAAVLNADLHSMVSTCTQTSP